MPRDLFADPPKRKPRDLFAPAPGEDFGASHVGQGLSGLQEGLVNAGDFAAMLLSAGTVRDAGTGVKKLLSDVGFIAPETDDPSKQFVRRAAETVGGSLPFGVGGALGSKGLVEGAKVLGGTLLSGTTGGLGAATAEQVAPGNEVAEFIGEMAGGLTPTTVAAALRRGAAAKAAPTVQQLEDEAGRLYEQAENSGVTFSQPVVKAKVDEITARALSEGIDPTIHPAATAALKRLQDAATRGLTVKEARTLRKVIRAAEKDFKNEDQLRIGGIMRRQFDELLNTVPELAPANALYTRASQGDLIETAYELAGSRAGQFSGSGFENALRTEFRALERAIIKGDLRGLPPDLVEAIRKVARGGKVENVLRFIGRFAPTNVVSSGLTYGVPFMIGNALGGPAVGAVAAGTAGMAGFGGRAAATALQKRNAAIAGALARRGGKPKFGPFLNDTDEKIAAALLGGVAANR